MINLGKFLPALKTGLGVVEDLAGIAKVVGGDSAAANAADLAATLAAVGRNVISRVEDASAVEVALNDHDQAEAKKVIDRLAAINDEMAAHIAAS